MYKLSEDLPVEDHVHDLVFLDAALVAARDDGELDAGVEPLLAELGEVIALGDALRSQREQEQRQSIKTEAKIRRTDTKQERGLNALFTDCMTQAAMDRQAPTVRLVFEGGLSAMTRPALEAQTETVREVIGKLESQKVYEGALRDNHVPALRSAADSADVLIAARQQHKRTQEAASEAVLKWKQRGNSLRERIGGWLMQRGAERGERSAKQYARDFFKR